MNTAERKTNSKIAMYSELSKETTLHKMQNEEKQSRGALEGEMCLCLRWSSRLQCLFSPGFLLVGVLSVPSGTCVMHASPHLLSDIGGQMLRDLHEELLFLRFDCAHGSRVVEQQLLLCRHLLQSLAFLGGLIHRRSRS